MRANRGGQRHASFVPTAGDYTASEWNCDGKPLRKANCLLRDLASWGKFCERVCLGVGQTSLVETGLVGNGRRAERHRGRSLQGVASVDLRSLFMLEDQERSIARVLSATEFTCTPAVCSKLRCKFISGVLPAYRRCTPPRTAPPPPPASTMGRLSWE